MRTLRQSLNGTDKPALVRGASFLIALASLM
jgi:hypothetical protein